MTKFKISATFILAACMISLLVGGLALSVGEEIECGKTYNWWMPITAFLLCGGFLFAGLFAGRESLGDQLVDEYWDEENREHVEREERGMLAELKRKYEE